MLRDARIGEHPGHRGESASTALPRTAGGGRGLAGRARRRRRWRILLRGRRRPRRPAPVPSVVSGCRSAGRPPR
ncbi:hypothetical protein QJS66_18920 [Kocuria rhizophila]|nr:hypothetical protein QJS66_18920 [Kocuria rhizophila]